MKLLEENTGEILQDKDVLVPSAHVTEAEKEKLKTPPQKKLVVYNKENKWKKTYVRMDWFLR